MEAVRSKRTISDREKEDGGTRKKVIKFRNYNPHTEELKEHKMKRTVPDSIEDQVSDQIEAGGHAQVEEVNLSNLAPKKANWDLKRDIASKLETLEKRTQKAIVELIRKKRVSDRERERERGIEDRLKGERLKDDSEELAAVVAAQGQDPDDTNDTQDS